MQFASIARFFHFSGSPSAGSNRSRQDGAGSCKGEAGEPTQGDTRTKVRLTAFLALGVMLSGCEAVLGADFDDYRRIGPDAAGTDASSGAGGAGGRAGGTSGGQGGASGASGGGDSGAAGNGGSGGAAAGSGGSGGGAAGNGSRTDAGGARPADASPPSDARSDASSSDGLQPPPPSEGGHGTVDGGVADGGVTPPRDGGITGGACTPGDVHTIAACGNCGLYLQTCNAQGTWDPPVCKQDDPQACPPGSTEHRACGTGGTALATCTASCTWMVGECVQPVCTAGQVDVQPCTFCGQQTRNCQATDAGGGQWGPFSACTGQGACAAGMTDVTTCGNCGTRSRACNASCGWDAWGACQGEGECAPGSTETKNCLVILILVLGHQTRTCDASCGWAAFDDCHL